jgi:hypothetical protein
LVSAPVATTVHGMFARTDDGKLIRRFYKEKAGWSQWALLSDRTVS